MKIEKLFKKIEAFFSIQDKKHKKREKKKEELIIALEKKISSMKDKIKSLDDGEKIQEIKKELDVLKNIRKKILE